MWSLLRQESSAVVASGARFMLGALVRYLFAQFAMFAPEQALPTTVAEFNLALATQLAANSVLLALLVAISVSIW